MVRGFDTHPGTGVFVFDFDGGRKLDVHPFGILLLKPVLGKSLGEELGAAVQDGDFEIVDLDYGIVHAHAGEGRHKMFDGGYAGLAFGNKRAAGGVGDILCQGGDFHA